MPPARRRTNTSTSKCASRDSAPRSTAPTRPRSIRFPVTFRIANNQIVVDRPFTNPESVIDPIYDDEDRFGRTNLFMWDAKVNGQWWRLFNGGNIGIAAGTEVRYETYSDKRASFVGVNPPGSGSQFPLLREGDNDFLALSSNVPIDANQTIYAAYLETALPFVTREHGVPLVNSLELTLAGRFEHFSIHGQTTKPKASLVWKPARWLKLRGSVAESFRAPNLVQTNITPLRRQIGADDPYRFEVTALPSDGTAQRTTFRQGNQNLQPEEANTWVAGFVLEVPKVRGLSVTFDYFKLNQNKVIENVGAAAAIDRDEVLLDLAMQAELAKGTPLAQIDLGSGTANYRGSNKVLRETVTAADRAAFADYNARPGSAAARAGRRGRQRDRRLPESQRSRHPGLRVRRAIPDAPDALRAVHVHRRRHALRAPPLAERRESRPPSTNCSATAARSGAPTPRSAGGRVPCPPAGSRVTSARSSTPPRPRHSRSTRRWAGRNTSRSSMIMASRAICCASIRRSTTTSGSRIALSAATPAAGSMA